MSLQKCSRCGDVGSFWAAYKAINLGRFHERKLFQCANCEHTMSLDRTERSLWQRLLVSFLWMTPSMFVIALFASGAIGLVSAVIAVIAFHFASLIWIIKTYEFTEN